MPRLSPRRALKNPQKLKRLLVVVALSIVAGIAVPLVALLAGLLEGLSPVELRSLGVVLEPAWILGLVTFLTVFVVGVVYVFFRKRLKRRVGRIAKRWNRFPPLAQVIIFALPIGGAAAGSVVAVERVWPDGFFPRYLPVLVFLVQWAGAAFLTHRHYTAKGELRRWGRFVVAGFVAGAALTLAVGGVDLFVLGEEPILPDSIVLGVFLAAWPLSTRYVIRRVRRDEEGWLADLLVESGYRQLQQLQTLSVALGIGFALGLAISWTADYFGADFQSSAFLFFAIWSVTSVGLARRFYRSSTERTDLVITGVRDRSSNAAREVTVTNTADDPVDLREAKIRDTEYDLYRLNIDVVLAGGETGVFDVPPQFALHPSEEERMTLPLGLSVRQGAEAPEIVTKEGEEFRLSWGADVDPDPGPEAGTGPDAGAGPDAGTAPETETSEPSD